MPRPTRSWSRAPLRELRNAPRNPAAGPSSPPDAHTQPAIYAIHGRPTLPSRSHVRIRRPVLPLLALALALALVACRDRRNAVARADAASASAPMNTPPPTACAPLDTANLARFTCASPLLDVPIPPVLDPNATLTSFYERIASLSRGAASGHVRIAMYGDSNLTADATHRAPPSPAPGVLRRRRARLRRALASVGLVQPQRRPPRRNVEALSPDRDLHQQDPRRAPRLREHRVRLRCPGMFRVGLNRSPPGRARRPDREPLRALLPQAPGRRAARDRDRRRRPVAPRPSTSTARSCHRAARGLRKRRVVRSQESEAAHSFDAAVSASASAALRSANAVACAQCASRPRRNAHWVSVRSA